MEKMAMGKRKKKRKGKKGEKEEKGKRGKEEKENRRKKGRGKICPKKFLFQLNKGEKI